MAAGEKWLLDTGPVVALLSQRDGAHDRCRDILAAFHGHLLTSEAVLTEAMHLLSRAPAGGSACLEFFVRAGAHLVPMSSARLLACRRLMDRYANVPMDFADATLVALGEELGIGRIFTLDRRGFGVYRWRRTRRFTIAP